MDTSTILKASNIKELKALGSYLEIKNSFERDLGSKLGATGWESFFDKINTLKTIVPPNKHYLTNIHNKKTFRDSKKEISELLDLKITAKDRNELKTINDNIITIFCTNMFDPYEYYERTKLRKFKNSSKLEGIYINEDDAKASLESVLSKYRR